MIQKILFTLCDISVFYFLTNNSHRITTSSIVSFFVALSISFLIPDLRKISNVEMRKLKIQNYIHYIFLQVLTVVLKGALASYFLIQLNMPILIGIVLTSIMTLVISRDVILRYAKFNKNEEETSLFFDNLNLFIILSILLRVLYMPTIDLSQQEAYYWNYSQRLSYGYLDHPPMVAWLIALGTYIFGNIEIGVRFFSLVAWAVAGRFLYLYSKNLFDELNAKVSLLLFATLPLYFGMGFFTTPDPFLIAAWSGMLYYLEKAIHSFTEVNRSWVLVGVCLGIGLISKYSIGLVGIASLTFIVIDKRARKSFFSIWPYISVVIALLIFSPVIVWNANHDWASFAFQTTRRLNEVPKFSLFKLIRYILLQLSPLGVFAALLSFLTPKSLIGREAYARRRHLFIACMTVAPLMVFVIFSLKHDVKMSWSAPLWLACFPLLAWQIINFGKGIWKRRHQYLWYISSAVVLLILGLGFNYLSIGLPGIKYRKDSPKFISYRQMGESVEELEDSFHLEEGQTEPLVVCMDSYSSASLISFYRNYSRPSERYENTEYTTSQNFFGLNGLMYKYWLAKPIEHNGKIIVTSIVSNRLEDKYLNQVTKKPYSYSEIKEVKLQKNKQRAGHYYYRIGTLIN